MMQLYAKGAGDTQRKGCSAPLDNEEVNAAEAAAVMRSRGARARAGSSMGRRWGQAEQSSSEGVCTWIEACRERLKAVMNT